MLISATFFSTDRDANVDPNRPLYITYLSTDNIPNRSAGHSNSSANSIADRAAKFCANRADSSTYKLANTVTDRADCRANLPGFDLRQ